MDNAEEKEIQTVDGIAVTAESPGFARSEMIDCGRCAKANPPNRFGCLYCGAELTVPANFARDSQLVPTIAEPWERAFNVIHISSGAAVERDVLAAVKLEPDVLKKAIESTRAIPLVRVAKLNEAEAIGKRLEDSGVRTAVVSDNELLNSRPPMRVRAIGFGDGQIAFDLFNSNEKVEIGCDDIRLFVVGFVYERRTESTVVKKGNANESTAFSDFGVIDIYAGDESFGYRITTNGFDFSCLGADKGMLAMQNLERLIEKFEQVFASARFDRQYRSLAKALDLIWPPAAANDSKGTQRIGFKVERSKGELVSNAEQFLKYSRLQSMYR